MKIVNYHLNSVSNVGDLASAPGLYFPEHAHEIHFADIDGAPQSEHKGVILGGGAILQRIIERQDDFNAPTVIWGAGYTIRGASSYVPFHLQADRYNLIGVRDFNTPYPWVPCASCLSPLFDRTYEITREYVFFENRPHGLLPYADMGNDCLDLPHVIQTLASAETVVTSSYHGAYWATLLGRRVLAFPFSSKFFGLRHPPVMIDPAHWKGARGQCWPDALHECRTANLAFAERVWSLFEL